MPILAYSPPPLLDGAATVITRLFPTEQCNVDLRLRTTDLVAFDTKDGSVLWTRNVTDSVIKGSEKKRTLVVKTGRTITRVVLGESTYFTGWVDGLRRASRWKLENFYSIGEKLGSGQYAEVYMGRDLKSDKAVAVKIVSKLVDDANIAKFVQRERVITRSLDHFNVIRAYDVFDCPERLCLVLEYMKGGMLADFIQSHHRFSEKDSGHIIAQVLSGLEYLHNQRIIHRDIKPDNILCVDHTFPPTVKIADFGLSCYVDSHEDGALPSLVGTPFYLAPEMLRKQRYGQEIDLWACGVVLHVLLSGRLPFLGTDIKALTAKIRQGNVSLPDKDWKDISNEAKDLVTKLLCSNPEKRIKASEALEHPFVVRYKPIV